VEVRPPQISTTPQFDQKRRGGGKLKEDIKINEKIMEKMENQEPVAEKATFKELRDVRSILDQVEIKDRYKLINLLESVNDAGYTFQDLIDILNEDCGQYVGSWTQPANVQEEK